MENVVVLNETNSVEILLHFINIAQQKGIFLLQESNLLKRCKDVLTIGAKDSEITKQNAHGIFIQAIVKGQKGGCYTLEESSTLFKVCQYLQQPQPDQPPQSVQPVQAPVKIDYFEEDDLSSLSDPVPIKMV